MNVFKILTVILLSIFFNTVPMDQPYSILLEGSNCSFKKKEEGIFIAGTCIIGMNHPKNWLIGMYESKQTYVVGFSQETQQLLEKLYKEKNNNSFDYMMIIKDMHFSVREIVDLNDNPKTIHAFPKNQKISY